MKKGAIALLLSLICSGCSGLEIGGKAWIMKVDEAESSQKTYAQPPLKCLFIDCASQAEEAARK